MNPSKDSDPPIGAGPGSIRQGIKWDLTLTVFLTIINIFGATAFWFSLPEKLKETKETLVDHEARIRTLEDGRGLLQRIDERTKTIQDDVRQLHQDYSFRMNNSPAKP